MVAMPGATTPTTAAIAGPTTPATAFQAAEVRNTTVFHPACMTVPITLTPVDTAACAVANAEAITPAMVVKTAMPAVTTETMTPNTVETTPAIVVNAVTAALMAT